MKKIKLLPRWCRLVGFLLLLPPLVLFTINPEVAFGDPIFATPEDHMVNATVISLVDDTEGEWAFFKVIQNDLINELMLSMMLIGAWMIAFARVKGEDEFSERLRLEAMGAAMFWNALILLILNFLIYEGLFLYVMIYQLFSYLLIFSLIFALRLRRERKDSGYEE